MPHWTRILLHHSKDKKGRVHSASEIREFHRSWKDLKAGEPLTQEEAERRISLGETGISRPWKDCGFHWAIELSNGNLEIIMLRPMTQNGSHAREGNLNKNSIGILLTGDFDVEEPSDELYQRLLVLCRYLMKAYKIPPENIVCHSEFNPRKQCPGRKFDVEKLRHMVRESIPNNQLSSDYE